MRGDLKRGRRRASLTPFEILERAIAGDSRSLALWREYERATKGRNALTWSPGLKARLGVDELLTDELAASTASGPVVVELTDTQWWLISRYHWDLRVLHYVEEGGDQTQLAAFLRPLHRRQEYDRSRAG